MPFADESVELVFTKVGNVWQKFRSVVVHGAAGNDPAHMRPETAVMGRVRIAFLISVLMMDAMDRNPKERPAFQRQSTADGQKGFHPFISFVTTVTQQAMVAHPNTEAAGNPP